MYNMNYDIYQAALQSLTMSGYFAVEQQEAIVKAIAVAIASIQITVIPPAGVPHHEHVIEEMNGHTHKLST